MFEIMVISGFGWDWKNGCWWIRLFGFGLQLKAPRFPKIFSERTNPRKVFTFGKGWRLVIMTPRL